MFSIIGINGRVGGGAASLLFEMGKQVRAVVRDEVKGHVWVIEGCVCRRRRYDRGRQPGTSDSGL
jgi:uncharacterized protein YbjT (DUF2867 family)